MRGFPGFLCLVVTVLLEMLGSHPKCRGWENTPPFPYGLLEKVEHRFAGTLGQPDSSHCTPRNPLSRKARIVWEKTEVQLLSVFIQMW